MKKIIVITSDGHSREDGNVYYSRYLLVESLSLAFDEPIFASAGVKMDGDGADERMDAVPDALRALGYIVHDIETKIITVSEDEPRDLDAIMSNFMSRQP